MSSTDGPSELDELLERGDAHRRDGDAERARACYEDAASRTEVPTAATCLRLARLARETGDVTGAQRWALAVVDAGDDFPSWQAASSLLGTDAGRELAVPVVRRAVRTAVVGSSTTNYLVPLLRLAARRQGMAFELYEAGYGQYEQEIIDPASGLSAFAPELVVLAVDESAMRLPAFTDDPETVVAAEVRRWTALWRTLLDRTGARIIHHGAVLPDEDPFGHFSASLPGSRRRMLTELNARLAEAAPADVTVLDVERLAARLGRDTWSDPRYRHLYQLPHALPALPVLARHTAAAAAAQFGLSRKCLAVDLDNTLWGGVIGEDGLAGIAIGTDAKGSPFHALQRHLLQLKERGVILAVCSKNDDDLAKLPFAERPEMQLSLDDIALFTANWQSKSQNLKHVAATLDIGLDAIAFLDDNPFERQEVRRLVPEVDVIALPEDPAFFVRALSDYTGFETTGLTAEDTRRTAQYRARAEASEMQASAASLDDYYRELRMRLLARPFEEVDVPRIAQLLGKTNQFNLTTRRHGVETVERFMRDPDHVTLSFRVRDRFVEHGLIGVMVGVRRGEVLEIDTWLMSCRVIGRGVEEAMMEHLEQRAADLGCTMIRGVYLPTAKNGLVADLYGRLGFDRVAEDDGATTWTLEVDGGHERHHHLTVTDNREDYDAAA